MITLELVHRILDYSPETGVFTFKVDYTSRQRAGMKAGCSNGRGYSIFMFEGQRILAHRMAWFYMTGAWPAKHIDHINGDGFDNRWCNLRESNTSQNMHNRKKQINNTSGYKGVSWDRRRKKWVMNLVYRDQNNKRHKIEKAFQVKEDAARAYNEVALSKLGEFAVLNDV